MNDPTNGVVAAADDSGRADFHLTFVEQDQGIAATVDVDIKYRTSNADGR